MQVALPLAGGMEAVRAGVQAAAVDRNEEVDPLTALGTIAVHCPQVVGPGFLGVVEQALGSAPEVRLLGRPPSIARHCSAACSTPPVRMGSLGCWPGQCGSWLTWGPSILPPVLQGGVMEWLAMLTLRLQPSPRLLAHLASSGVLEELLGSALLILSGRRGGSAETVGAPTRSAGCRVELSWRV